VNTFRKLRDIAVLTRPHNCLIALISVLAGAFLAPGGISSGAVLASVMVFFGCAGAYVLNDTGQVTRSTSPGGRSPEAGSAWQPGAVW